MNVTRRELLGFAGVTAGMVALGGVGKAFAGEDELLRPPGATDTAEFWASCLKCNRCQSICPQHVIDLGVIENGLLNARTPIMNFHHGYCDFCNKCIEVCTAGSLREFDPYTQKIGIAVVQEDRCRAFFTDCTTCIDSCEYEALVFDSANRPVIDPEKCNGCGKCEYDCTALVYGSFEGGNRRGITVVTPAKYERLTDAVEGA